MSTDSRVQSKQKQITKVKEEEKFLAYLGIIFVFDHVVVVCFQVAALVQVVPPLVEGFAGHQGDEGSSLQQAPHLVSPQQQSQTHHCEQSTLSTRVLRKSTNPC